MIFWDRFCELCKEKGVTPTQMVKDAGIAVGSVTKWKNGSIPHGNTRKKIAEYFSVSEKDLFESPDQKENPTTNSSLISGFGMLMRQVRERKGVTVEQMACDLGISASLLIGIEARGAQPALNTAIKIANYLEVSTDYLLGREENEFFPSFNELHSATPYAKKPSQYFTTLSNPQDREFLELYSKLTPEERKIILDLIKNFASNKT